MRSDHTRKKQAARRPSALSPVSQAHSPRQPTNHRAWDRITKTSSCLPSGTWPKDSFISFISIRTAQLLSHGPATTFPYPYRIQPTHLHSSRPLNNSSSHHVRGQRSPRRRTPTRADLLGYSIVRGSSSADYIACLRCIQHFSKAIGWSPR